MGKIKTILYSLLKGNSYLLVRKISRFKHLYIRLTKVRKYNRRKHLIIENKARKDSIVILFLVSRISMWKYDGLIKLLLQHPRFIPIVVPYVRPNQFDPDCRKCRDEIVLYCKANNVPFREWFDFSNGQYLDISDINPDIVIYTQPYKESFPDWNVDNYTQDCLFVYTPYGISTSRNKNLKDTYLTNIVWKLFVSCKLEKKIYEDNMSTNRESLVVTGMTLLDDLRNADLSKNPWPNNKKKKIIWAPHHSIDSLRGFSNSNFERVCIDMLEMATKYQSEIEIAFKPHPILYDRLNEKWGREKTHDYYTQWNKLPNTIICEGSYVELFAFSDAMIHDCASFTCEYLCTSKPVMFLCKDEHLSPPAGIGNELGVACFEHHYCGYSIQDIENFIVNVVIEGNDTMKSQRNLFVQEQLFLQNSNTVAENMLRELETLFH